MQPITTLLDRSSLARGPHLPARLQAAYGGDLDFPAPAARPVYVLANFVTTLDGVVSYQIPGKSGGGEISGINAEDLFIMALLRSLADAVMVGSGTLHGDSGHVRTPEAVCPELRDEFRSFRQTLLHKPLHPLNVIVSGSGAVNLDEPTFHTPGLSTLIITTEAGRDRLRRDHGRGLSATQVRTSGDQGSRFAPSSILQILREEFAVKQLVLEGGPTLCGQFLAEGEVDELFLTQSPQIAGRSDSHPRPSFAGQTSFLPDDAPWFELLSLKTAGSHLYARYKRNLSAGTRPASRSSFVR
jgi:riboflavin biosynthesis pyrimidine reductase